MAANSASMKKQQGRPHKSYVGVQMLTLFQDLQSQYTNYKNTLQSLAQKAGELEQEIEEHKLVTETLQPLPKDRKCFRLINGVLVERTVEAVLPALETNSDGLKKVLEELLKQYKSMQDEMDSWKVRQPLESMCRFRSVIAIADKFNRRSTTSKWFKIDTSLRI